jgi:ABC-type polysaccharide/polyol phosphate transport system ATPase subunit
VELDGVGLAYRVTHGQSASFKQHALDMVRRRVVQEDLWALRDLDLKVYPGEVLAVVGANGAGKSTLMKLVARVLPPSTGRVRVRGRLAPMIELGAGFNPELTAEENVLLYGSILGRDPARLRARVGAIAEWAELNGRMTSPLRTFSSGMVARLAFSTAVDVQPDVLLVDEVLSVGDEAFQRRCEERIDEMVRAGACVVLVTHNMRQVLTRATRAVLLEKGHATASGNPADVVAAYRSAAATGAAGA